MSDSISYNGAMFLLFLFISIVVFFVLSSPVDQILDGVLGMDGLTSSDEIDLYVPAIKIAVRIAFSLSISTPLVWFAIKMFNREPAYYTNKKNKGGTF